MSQNKGSLEFLQVLCSNSELYSAAHKFEAAPPFGYKKKSSQRRKTTLIGSPIYPLMQLGV